MSATLKATTEDSASSNQLTQCQKSTASEPWPLIFYFSPPILIIKYVKSAFPPPPLMMIMLGFKRVSVSGQDTAQICPPVCNNRKSITDDMWDNSFWRHDIRKERTIIYQVGLTVAYRFTALRRISGCSTERKNPGEAWPVLWDKEKELRGRAQRKPTGICRVHTREFSRARISSCK